ncbi:MAG: hypothetical protein WDO18_06130 [Acidobacteriota bacterium]
MRVGVTTLRDVEDRLSQIAKVRATPNFEPLAASFKRINNILKQANFDRGSSIPNCSKRDLKKKLYDAYGKLAFGPLENVRNCGRM